MAAHVLSDVGRGHGAIGWSYAAALGFSLVTADSPQPDRLGERQTRQEVHDVVLTEVDEGETERGRVAPSHRAVPAADVR